MGKKHRATGNPVGRPPSTPSDLSAMIYQSLAKRVDKETGLVRPHVMNLAREFKVSRSTIWRRTSELCRNGLIELVYVKITPDMTKVFYRLH